MNKCYICDKPLESYVDCNTANHVEHIIPQSLGGQLRVSGILCKECGGEKYLGGNIDKPFSDVFSLITKRLDIKKDRKTNSIPLSGKLKLFENGNSIDVCLKDNILSHSKPEFEIDHKNKIAYIFCNAKVAKSYKKYVENKLKQQVDDYSIYQFKVISDLTSLDSFLGVLELPFNLNNDVFHNGFKKIAIEFALFEKINISHLSHLIDKENRTFTNDLILTPYYPIIKVEEAIEVLRTSIDDNFMSHSLVLFSQKQIHEKGHVTKQLYCFIELFGTFQYFVCLNDNYNGEDVEPRTYSQKIIRESPYEINIDNLSPKDLSIYLMEFNLSYKDVEGKNYDEIKKHIENVNNSKNRYIFDYEKNMKCVVEKMLRDSILLSQTDILSIGFDIISHFYRNPDEDDFHIKLFRSRFFKKELILSIFPEISDLYQKNPEKFKRYTYFKFKELEHYINENNSS